VPIFSSKGQQLALASRTAAYHACTKPTSLIVFNITTYT